MTGSKRVFDLVLSLLLLVVLLPFMAVISVVIAVVDGRPVFYIATRMTSGRTHSPMSHRPFGLIKFRTMRPDPDDHGVSGGDKSGRITRTGRVLRRFRLDELPQIINVLRGDISLVGPRPPLPHYVALCPDLYAQVLRSRPGITGLATLVFHKREERLLRRSQTAAETEAIYLRRCVPVKARIDLIYAARRSLWLDLWLMLASVLPLPAVPRWNRIWRRVLRALR